LSTTSANKWLSQSGYIGAIIFFEPFVCFYFIGRLGVEVIFTFFAAIFVVIMNVLNLSKIED